MGLLSGKARLPIYRPAVEVYTVIMLLAAGQRNTERTDIVFETSRLGILRVLHSQAATAIIRLSASAKAHMQ